MYLGEAASEYLVLLVTVKVFCLNWIIDPVLSAILYANKTKYPSGARSSFELMTAF